MFFWGCVGGLAPDVVLLYKFRHRKYEVYNWVQYGVALLAIILLAGLVTAGVVRPPDPFSALYTGITVPIMISTFLGKDANPFVHEEHDDQDADP